MSLTRVNPYHTGASCVDSFDEDSAESSRSIACLFEHPKKTPPPVAAADNSEYSVSDSASEISSSEEDDLQNTLTLRLM